ncbi:glutamine--scyllo-inositol transaminase [Candidatus Brocadia pituitae]|nr:glutamine--scyllo-inositol transaminase [Candidatus Brocadia pituitae]
MAKILVDINVLLDDFLNRDVVCKELIDKLVESQSELFITASMAATLDYFLNKYEADKSEFKRKFFGRFKIITTSGFDALKALDFEDGEDALISLSFQRAVGEGIIITNDKGFPSNSVKVLTPKEALKQQDIFNNENNKTIPILDLKKQYYYLIEDIDNAVLKNIADAKYILGSQVKELEDKIAGYIGVKHCIGMSSGTEALVLSLRALAIKLKGQEYFDKTDGIITTPFTFTATGDAVLRAGATPVFVDIDPITYNIDPAEIRECLKSEIQNPKSKIRGIIPVHLYGKPCNMDEIMDIAKEYNLFVLEDVAQAFGGTWRDKKLGSIGTAGTFSFFPSKNLGGFGDGGMVSTNDDELAELMRMLLKHGGKDKYNVDHIGYNARLDTLQAAILLAKFKFIDEFNAKRRSIAEVYNKELSGIGGLVLPGNNSTPQLSNSLTQYFTNVHVYHQYTIRVLNGKRDSLQKHLKEKGIDTMVYYPVPLHKMEVFDGRCRVNGGLKESEKAVKEVLSLPMEPLVGQETIMKVVETIKSHQ